MGNCYYIHLHHLNHFQLCDAYIKGFIINSVGTFKHYSKILFFSKKIIAFRTREVDVKFILSFKM